MTIGWLDCSAGASGDMFLGALVDAGVPLDLLQRAVDGLGTEPVRLWAEPVLRRGLGATQVHVEAPAAAASRTWSDIRGLLASADLDPAVRGTAEEAFRRLAAAEAAVHRVPMDDVHFHEVGALDALADIVGACAGLHALGLTALIASPATVGYGATTAEHGALPLPAPAVLQLLRGLPVRSGPVSREMTTPTGAALLATLVTQWGELPAMRLGDIGIGAGSRDLTELPNVLRLVLGAELDRTAASDAVVLEANVDDLDPRLWPGVLQQLLDHGAHDAWLTPILMKKGRPAYTLAVLCSPEAVDAMRRVVVTETSTIGFRLTPTRKQALDRAEMVVEVDRQPVRVKLASFDGEVVNANPEYEDVVAAAAALRRPVKLVLAAAVAAAQRPMTAGQTATKKASTPTGSDSGTATTS